MNEIFSNLKSINYWEGKPKYDIGYIRNFYLDKIIQSFDNKLIKVIAGQRRCGKSYILRQIIDFLMSEKNIPAKNIFYLNKEQYEFNAIENDTHLAEIIKLYEEKLKPSGKIYLFIDEVQNITNWEKIIVSFAQHPTKEYEIFITGSNSRLLSGELASYLSGRYILFEIFPFSYTEFLQFHSLNDTNENFIKYLETTGLPETYKLKSEEIKKHYFNSLKDTILLKDIMYRYKIRDYVLLEDIFLFLLHNLGNLFSITSIIKYFKSKNRKADYTTIASYLSYMEETYIIHASQRFHIKTKELLSGEKKYYVNDLGFRNYLFPYLKTNIASSLENIVFSHLKINGYKIYTGVGNDFEIDFIAHKFDNTIYIQVTYLLASDEIIKREFRPLELLKNSFPKYVVSLDDMQIYNEKGIKHMHLRKFLQEVN